MRFRLLFAFGLTLPLGLFAAAAQAEEPVAGASTPAPTPPATDLPPPSARTTTIVAGAATTVVSFGLALGASYLWSEDDLRGSKDLRIPIAGPWMSLGRTGCPTGSPDCSAVTLVIGTVLKIFDGVAQAGGLGVIGEGLFLNTSSAKAAPQKAATGPTVHAVPFNFERGGVGIGLVGSF